MVDQVDQEWTIHTQQNLWEVTYRGVHAVTVSVLGSELHASRPHREVPDHVLEELPHGVANAIRRRRRRH